MDSPCAAGAVFPLRCADTGRGVRAAVGEDRIAERRRGAAALRLAVRSAQERFGLADPPPIRVERQVFTSESKLTLMDNLALALSRRGILYPHCAGLLAELRGFEYAGAGLSGRPRMAARGAGHDDIVTALALALWCAPTGALEPPASRVLLGSMAGAGRG